MSARRAARKIWRAVSRSTSRIGRPTARTRPRRAGRDGGGRFRGRRWCHGERLTTLSQLAGARARGEKPEIPDADEALREHVHEEATEKLVDVERQRLDLVAVAIVLPPKRDGVGGDVDEPVIGNGHAVGVPREVVQDVGGAAKGRFGVDHPRLTIERPQPRAKGHLRGERGEGAGEVEAALCPRLAKPGDQFPAKDLPQDLHREKEGRARVEPLCPVGRQATRGHDAVDVGMMLEPLPPGVQDHEPADVRAQARRIRGDLLQRLRSGPNQPVVHHALVGERETRERLWHGEDEVDVPDRQEFLLTRGHPRVPGRSQTLGAMPIAAAVIREGRVCALVTAIPVPAERRRAALGDGPEDAPMLPGDPRAVRLQELIAMLAHDVGHLKGWPRHRWCFRRVRRAVSGPASVRASSGLATACRCFCERWR